LIPMLNPSGPKGSIRRSRTVATSSPETTLFGRRQVVDARDVPARDDQRMSFADRIRVPQGETGVVPHPDGALGGTAERALIRCFPDVRGGERCHIARSLAASDGPPALSRPGTAIAVTSRVKVRDVLRILRDSGWTEVRQAGSHRHFAHSEKPGIVTVAGSEGSDIPTGTLRGIYRQAGLDWKTGRP
jgi:predicted RNA binding protein YcfA (HicA-like mRNA interferase family)